MRILAALIVALLFVAACSEGEPDTTIATDQSTTATPADTTSSTAEPETSTTGASTTTTAPATTSTSETTSTIVATTTTTLPGGGSTASCVNGWVTPTPGTPLRTDPLDMIRGLLGLSAGDLFVVDDMRYFVGPEDVEIAAPRRDVERWYVKASQQNDPSIGGRWIVRRINIGEGVAYSADYSSVGYEEGTWVGYEGGGAEYEPFHPPCTATHGPYCTCDWGVSGCSCSDTNHPACWGPPPEVMGCLDGT